MSTPLDLEIRSKVAAVLSGDIALRDFYHWFVPATWDVERNGNREAIRMTHELAHLFSELSAGMVPRDEVQQRLEAAVAMSTRSAHQRIA